VQCEETVSGSQLKRTDIADSLSHGFSTHSIESRPQGLVRDKTDSRGGAHGG
jgi:hypothetical protein